MKQERTTTEETPKNLRLRGRVYHVEAMIDGEDIRVTTKCTDLREAIKVRDKIIARKMAEATERRAEGPPRDTDFDDAASIYFKDNKDALRAQDEAERVIARVIELIGPHTMCSQITAGVLFRIRAYLLSLPPNENKRGQPRKNEVGLAPKTINKYLEMIIRILNHLEAALPTELPHKPDPARDDIYLPTTGRGRYLSEIDEHLLLEECDQDTRDCIEFDLETGLRAAELVGATWEMVDVIEESITVPIKARGLDPVYHTVFLSPKALAILDRRRGRSQHENIFTFEAGLTYWKDGELIRKGTHIAATYSLLQRKYQDAVDDAGLSDLILHDLRRTAARRIFFEGGIELAQAFLGHRDRQTTEDYLCLTPADTKAAIRHRAKQQEERMALVKSAARRKPTGDPRVARIRAELDRRARQAKDRRVS